MGKIAKISALGGVRLGSAATGARYQGRDDLMLVEMPAQTSVAGVFTRSNVQAAPVHWCRRHIGGGRAQGLLVNAGNANACTGRQGDAVVKASARAVAKHLGCSMSEVLLASTGVIGEPLDSKLLVEGIGRAHACLKGDESHWHAAAGAIMTTDTFPKGVSKRFKADGDVYILNGIAKGSGMIAPNMATMLAFFFTDAKISKASLGRLLRGAADESFHRISVDGDNSTNDTVLLFATGTGSGKSLSAKGLRRFSEVLCEAATELARLIIMDGEGARKFITVEVKEAISKPSARRVGFAVANSPLVKTALSGEDANWGRIAMAIGKSGERMDAARLAISMGGVTVARRGAAVALNSNNRRKLARHMRKRDLHIGISLGVGKGADEVWTCDLSHEYVSINADYRS